MNNIKINLKKILSKNDFIFNIFRSIYRFLFDFVFLKIIGNILKIFPINNKKIIMCSYYGMDYGDNPKAIADVLLQKDVNHELDIVWILDKKIYNMNSVPKNIRIVKNETFACLYELVTAKIWVDNSRKRFVPSKRKKQFYIQTWHGGLCQKKIEKDAIESLPNLYIKRAVQDSKNADLFLSNSKWETNLYRNAFWYAGKILEIGLPRNDILIQTTKHAEIKKNVYKNLNIDFNTKILLYAPTFRKNYGLDCYDMDYNKLLSFLEQKTSNNWVILIKLHPNIANKANNICYNKKIIDVSNYPDLYELMIATDTLITDYSSLMFDFGYLNKPIFIYASDIDNYILDRGFMFNLYELPFSISKNTKELLNKINQFDNDKYLDKLKKFYNNVGLNETGKSSEEVAKIILKECECNEKK